MKKKKKILLVDDNTDSLREMRSLLNSISFKDIFLTDSIDKAWVIVNKKQIDCVICTWEMTAMSGLSLLRSIRNEDNFFNLPFFLSHHAFTKIKVIQAGHSGVTGLFVKPYSANNVKQKLLKLPAQYNIPEPTYENDMLEKGKKFAESGSFEKAISVLDTLLENGETAEFYYNKGYILTTENRFEEAIRAFKKATQLDRLFAKAYQEMGKAYLKLGRRKEAEKYLQKAADINMENDDIETAEKILNDIMEMDPQTVNIYNSLGVLHRKKGNLEFALKQYIKALKVHPEEPFIMYNIGRLYLDMNNAAKGKEYFEMALKQNPQFKEAKQVIRAIELGSL
ncbi:MAG: tetratricopeptide repeat protein [Desulfobacterales bacterium]|nr:tetratricopeptide repeat protein [Desulfobacterales bacterium]MCP4160732.1 tetratricopeptide repeat protein [Deltaproteobacteria bacterium]